ncbi:MAG: DNA repair protein RadA [Legionellales bacterium RIFCSPHIGHO2_12_FULL_37_14]|nr:MAG: DNA repair protein RadA [Legionellales bacterium RIFCSPHIGHO2_12_FULL_37_14]
MNTKTKSKTNFVCQSCGANSSRWAGQCVHCNEWNCLVELKVSKAPLRITSYANERSKVVLAEDVSLINEQRFDCGNTELNRVLGGGVVEGSIVLIGGDPGIGKSTLLLQTMAHLSQEYATLYVTGEESLQQVVMRAKRLNLQLRRLQLLAETHIESILANLKTLNLKVVVIDSIQTLFTEEISSSPGTVSQVRECAGKLVQFAKTANVAVFIVGHVTKDGVIAGPRVLEHMVDSVLYFEGEGDSRFRLIRSIKNRFGAANELGIFAMTEKGLKPVANPSALFLSRHTTPTPGSVTMVSWEGSRPLLVEIQALVDQAFGQAKRLAAGVDSHRVNILLAVLHKHAGVATYDQDVFLNVVGGVKITETASDLAIIAAVLSSFKNRVIDANWVIFGEVGLAGEIRPVREGQERLKAAAKHGFTKAIVPLANVSKQEVGLEVIGVQTLEEMMSILV